jgi:hypothetical protein
MPTRSLLLRAATYLRGGSTTTVTMRTEHPFKGGDLPLSYSGNPGVNMCMWRYSDTHKEDPLGSRTHCKPYGVSQRVDALTFAGVGGSFHRYVLGCLRDVNHAPLPVRHMYSVYRIGRDVWTEHPFNTGYLPLNYSGNPGVIVSRREKWGQTWSPQLPMRLSVKITTCPFGSSTEDGTRKQW